RTIGFFAIAAVSFIGSYGVNSYFFDLTARSPIDQKLMIFFLACALTFILFMVWIDGVKIGWKWNPPRLTWNSLLDNLPGIALAILFCL
ncbi:MAG: hypothetical protein L6Q26_13290, partial [Anaerolineales bacterium]|nr:hypothetical protein [Anaerolineales bacterium]